ncbi:MAG: hypothetical protein V1753_06805 [Pseudomonadota bacterium]
MKKLAVLSLAIMMFVAFTGIVAMAEEAAAPAGATSEVTKIDQAAGTVTVKGPAGEETELKAEPAMLEGIAVGDHVAVESAEGTVKSIKKEEAAH